MNDLDTKIFYEFRVELRCGTGFKNNQTFYFPAHLIHSSLWHRPFWDVIPQESVCRVCAWDVEETPFVKGKYQWKYKLCWGRSIDKTLNCTDVRISFSCQGNRGQPEVKGCLTTLCLPGLREQWVGHQCGWGWELWRAGPHLRHPPSCHRQSQDQRQVVGHRQGQLQKDPDGKYPTKPGVMLWGLGILGVWPSACPLLELFIPNPAVSSGIRKLIIQRAPLRHKGRGNLPLVSKTMPILNWAESNKAAINAEYLRNVAQLEYYWENSISKHFILWVWGSVKQNTVCLVKFVCV